MKSWKVLIVDDEQDVHDVTKLALKRLQFKDKDIELFNSYNVSDAKEILQQQPDLALLLLDIVMEEDSSGLELVQYIREELLNDKIQIIIRTGHPGRAPVDDVIFKYEVNDYQEKSELTSYKLKTSIITALRAYNSLNKIDLLNKEVESAQTELFFSLGRIAESRSQETGNHVKRVGEIVKLICGYLKFNEHDSEQLKLAASMHDIGKMAIQDSIINKPGKLTPEEFEIMKGHSMIGYEMLISSEKKVLNMAAIIAKEHHENYDGTGYPMNLKGNEISIESRIVAIADVFDALGNKRVYKDPWSLNDILDFMNKEKSKKFDPHIIDIVFENIDELAMIREKYPD